MNNKENLLLFYSCIFTADENAHRKECKILLMKYLPEVSVPWVIFSFVRANEKIKL